jgi:hypothetical protein
VALIDCVGLLGDIVRQAVTAQPDIEVIAELEPSATVATFVDGGLDLAIWNNADESLVAQSLSEVSKELTPRVLATLDDGRKAAIWELSPMRTELEQLSPASLVDAIRKSLATIEGVTVTELRGERGQS